MASSATLLSACSETSIPTRGPTTFPANKSTSANRAAKKNSTKRTRTEDNHTFDQKECSFYGQYDHRSSTRSAPAFLGGSHAGLTVPPEKNHFLREGLDGMFHGLYAYPIILIPHPTAAEDLVHETIVRSVPA